MVIIFHLFIRLPVNKLRPRLRVDKFLTRIQAVITRETKADCNHQHEKRHRLIAKKLKAQQKRWQAQAEVSFLFRVADNFYIGPMASYDYVIGKHIEPHSRI